METNNKNTKPIPNQNPESLGFHLYGVNKMVSGDHEKSLNLTITTAGTSTILWSKNIKL